MSLVFIIRPQAEQDLATARDWYEGRRDGLGIEFLIAAEEVFTHIRAFPEAYAAEYRGVRRAGLRGFPYVVYYRIISERVDVLAVLHGSRAARVWQRRL